MKKIGVLGQGITASAVKEFIKKASNYKEVSVNQADIIVTSPGIPPNQWPQTSVEIISDIEFAFRELINQKKKPIIIGVTGTNGKTTVAAGIAHGLGVKAYGNIGRPLIGEINMLDANQPIVLELSSFQLFASPSLHCDIAIIINIESDHLDWHGSHENYKAAKFNFIKSSNQQVYIPQKLKKDIQIKNYNFQIIEDLPSIHWPQFFGKHNKRNAALIHSVVSTVNNTIDVNNIMASFKLPPFRCESIYSKNKLTVINDSKATNMSATMAAIQSVTEEKLLILSGQPKGNYTIEWLTMVFASCHSVYAAGYLNEHRDVFPIEFQSKIVFFSNLKLATIAAINATKKGVILFSPSAASFDEFNDYIDRGQAFNSYVFKIL